jgi:hypothetical protein
MNHLDGAIDFDALGERLQRFEGEEVCALLAYVRDEVAVPWAGGRGRLHVVTEAEVEAQLEHFGGYELPEGIVREGERMHLLEIGELQLALDSEDYHGACDVEGHLSCQVGPMLVNLAIARGDTDA